MSSLHLLSTCLRCCPPPLMLMANHTAWPSASVYADRMHGAYLCEPPTPKLCTPHALLTCRHGVYFSDFPPWDAARELVLLAEERAAESSQREALQEATRQLRAANEKLADASRWEVLALEWLGSCENVVGANMWALERPGHRVSMVHLQSCRLPSGLLLMRL